MTRIAIRIAGAGLLAAILFGPLLAARPIDSDGVHTADVRAVLDDFEHPQWPDPALWQLPDTTPGWHASSCRSRWGQRSLRAFATTGSGVERACDARVPAGSRSTGWLTLDLRAASDANQLELLFELWMEVDPGAVERPSGLFIYLLVQEQGGVSRVPVFGATGRSGRWVFPERRLDLRNLVDVRSPGRVYDLRGAIWRMEWEARAPDGAPPGGGIYIDHLSLQWEPDVAVPTPTERPTAVPSRTSSPSPSATGTPTGSPTPPPSPEATPTAPWHAVYLPISRTDPSPTPAASPAATTAASPTAGTPTSTPSATLTTPSPTPSPADVIWLPVLRLGGPVGPDPTPEPEHSPSTPEVGTVTPTATETGRPVRN